MKRKIAIVVSDLTQFGGVPAVAKYLYEIINASDKYEARLISVSTSVNDRDSLRIMKPSTWLKRASVSTGEFFGYKFKHFGANFTEIEPCRYLPRKMLDEELTQFDLIQIVAGTPAWANIAKNSKSPVALQVATLIDVERVSVLRETSQPRKTWLKAMTYFNRALEKRALRRGDLIFVENSWLYEHLLDNGFGEKTVFAQPGIDTDFFIPRDYKKDGYLLCVGRFDDPRKNVRLLLAAYKELCDIEAQAPKLVLAGKSGLLEKDIDFAKEIGVYQKIEIIKDLSMKRLREVYQNAALFVLSSDEEGLGLVIIEAMSCGLPVVSTRNGGAEEIVVDKETGFLVPKGNPTELAQKIKLLFLDPSLRKQMGIKSRKRIVKSFSKKETAKIFLQQYDKLLENHTK